MEPTQNLAEFIKWGPYVSYGMDAAHHVRIAWKSDQYARSSCVRFGITPECTQKEEDSWGLPTFDIMVHLSNLKPNTKYYYKISRTEDEKKLFSFVTAPDPAQPIPFEFTIIGDMHAYPENPTIKKYFDLMSELVPNHQFCATVGDCINDGLNRTHWNAFFHAAQEYQQSRVLMNATGNHDTANEAKYCRFVKAWPHEYANVAKGAFYLMEYSNAVFFFLDSCNGGGWEGTPADEQYEWLEENLKKYAKKDKWIFLFLHHQIFSTGDFGCPHFMEDFYRNLCQEYQIDAIFYGHDHHYEMYWVDREMEYGGTLYSVVGAGGGQHHIDHGIMGDRDGKTKYVWPGRVLNVRKMGVPPLHANILGDSKTVRNDKIVGECQLLGVLEPNFVAIKIDGDTMNLRCIGWQKQIYHEFNIKRAGTGRKFSNDSEKVIYGNGPNQYVKK